MNAPQQEPLLLRLDRWAELRVVDDEQAVVMQFDAPDSEAAPLFESRLTVEQAIDLIDRLVGRVTYLRKLAKPEGSGPLSSTF